MAFVAGTTPRPFTNMVAIEDRILVIDHDPFLPFCSDASDPDTTDGNSDSTAAED
jgi:hypothetical protein